MSREYDLFEKIENGLGDMITIDAESILDNDLVRINSEEELFGMTAAKPKAKKKRWMKPFAGVAIAASLLIGCFGVFGGAEIQGQLIVDVNPSVALDIGKDYTVSGVEALNKDGEEIVKAMNLHEGEVTEVLTELSDVLDSRGYIDDDDSGILISYCNRDTKAGNAQKRETLKEETIRFIGEYFESNEDKKTTVFYQEFERNNEDCEGAKENNISEGKYHFISQLNMTVAEKFDSNDSMKDIVKQLKENQISVGMVNVYNSRYFKGDGQFCGAADVIKSENDKRLAAAEAVEKVSDEGDVVVPVSLADVSQTDYNNQGNNNDHQNYGHQQNPNNGQSEKNDNKNEDVIILGAKDDIEEIGAEDEIIDDADNILDDNKDIEDDQGEEDDCLGDDTDVQDQISN